MKQNATFFVNLLKKKKKNGECQINHKMCSNCSKLCLHIVSFSNGYDLRPNTKSTHAR